MESQPEMLTPEGLLSEAQTPISGGFSLYVALFAQAMSPVKRRLSPIP